MTKFARAVPLALTVAVQVGVLPVQAPVQLENTNFRGRRVQGTALSEQDR